jgi:hypothetical protein
LSINNGDGTYTAVLCASTISPYNVPVCVQGGLESACGESISWIQTGSCNLDNQCVPVD